MKKIINKTVTCPCCQIDSHHTEIKQAIDQMELLGKAQYKNYKELGFNVY